MNTFPALALLYSLPGARATSGARRSGERTSWKGELTHVTSALPRWTAATFASTRPGMLRLISIRSANPAGRAAVGRKWALRTSAPPRGACQPA